VTFSDSVLVPEPVGEGGEGVVPHPDWVVMILLHQFPAEKKIWIEKPKSLKDFVELLGPLLIKIG
jgi:hypothetical protein